MIPSITITIARTTDGLLRAELSGQMIVGATLDELMDNLKQELAPILTGADIEIRPANGRGAADDMAELAQLSRTATGQSTLLELAGTSPPPPSWYDEDDL